MFGLRSFLRQDSTRYRLLPVLPATAASPICATLGTNVMPLDANFARSVAVLTNSMAGGQSHTVY
jgi:hypothetical protein